MSDACEMVPLPGGVTLPARAIRFAVDLAFRGVTMRLRGDDLVVSPKHLVTAADIATIRELREALVAVVRYDESMEARQ